MPVRKWTETEHDGRAVRTHDVRLTDATAVKPNVERAILRGYPETGRSVDVVRKHDCPEEFQIQDALHRRVAEYQGELPLAKIPAVYFRTDADIEKKDCSPDGKAVQVVMENVGMHTLAHETADLRGMQRVPPLLRGRPLEKRGKKDFAQWTCATCASYRTREPELMPEVDQKRLERIQPYVWWDAGQREEEEEGVAATEVVCSRCVAEVGGSPGMGRVRFPTPITVTLHDLLMAEDRSFRQGERVEVYDETYKWIKAKLVQKDDALLARTEWFRFKKDGRLYPISRVDAATKTVYDWNGNAVPPQDVAGRTSRTARLEYGKVRTLYAACLRLNGFAFWEIMRRVAATLQHLNRDGHHFVHGDLHSLNVLVRLSGAHCRRWAPGLGAQGLDVRVEDVEDVFLIDFGWSYLRGPGGEEISAPIVRQLRDKMWERNLSPRPPAAPGMHRDLLTLYLSMKNVPQNWAEVHALVEEFIQEIDRPTRPGHRRQLTWKDGFRGNLFNFTNARVKWKDLDLAEKFRTNPDLHYMLYDNVICPTVERDGKARPQSMVYRETGAPSKCFESARPISGARWQTEDGAVAILPEYTVMSKFVPAHHLDLIRESVDRLRAKPRAEALLPASRVALPALEEPSMSPAVRTELEARLYSDGLTRKRSIE